MEFDSNKPIYIQICDNLCERILNGELKPEDRLLSVREYGASIGVNPNTIARSYEKMTDAGIIYNKRGIGYFISTDAPQIIRSIEKEKFLSEEVPKFLKKMNLLGISPDQIF